MDELGLNDPFIEFFCLFSSLASTKLSSREKNRKLARMPFKYFSLARNYPFIHLRRDDARLCSSSYISHFANFLTSLSIIIFTTWKFACMEKSLSSLHAIIIMNIETAPEESCHGSVQLITASTRRESQRQDPRHVIVEITIKNLSCNPGASFSLLLELSSSLNCRGLMCVLTQPLLRWDSNWGLESVASFPSSILDKLKVIDMQTAIRISNNHRADFFVGRARVASSQIRFFLCFWRRTFCLRFQFPIRNSILNHRSLIISASISLDERFRLDSASPARI